MTPWNGSHACSGEATAIADINMVVAATPVSAERRRTGNGSKRQISHNSGTATRPDTANCICKRGNTDSSGPGKSMYFQEPYLRRVLGFIGLKDVTFIHAEGLNISPETATGALDGARATIAELLPNLAA